MGAPCPDSGTWDSSNRTFTRFVSGRDWWVGDLSPTAADRPQNEQASATAGVRRCKVVRRTHRNPAPRFARFKFLSSPRARKCVRRIYLNPLISYSLICCFNSSMEFADNFPLLAHTRSMSECQVSTGKWLSAVGHPPSAAIPGPGMGARIGGLRLMSEKILARWGTKWPLTRSKSAKRAQNHGGPKLIKEKKHSFCGTKWHLTRSESTKLLQNRGQI
jgi:hypothetical protein